MATGLGHLAHRLLFSMVLLVMGRPKSTLFSTATQLSFARPALGILPSFERAADATSVDCRLVDFAPRRTGVRCLALQFDYDRFGPILSHRQRNMLRHKHAGRSNHVYTRFYLDGSVTLENKAEFACFGFSHRNADQYSTSHMHLSSRLLWWRGVGGRVLAYGQRLRIVYPYIFGPLLTKSNL